MRKIIARLKSGYIQTLAYRSEVFLWLFLDSFPVGITILIWLSIYQGKETIGNYSISNMVLYFCLVLIINSISASHFEQFRVEQIRMGKIDYFLTRPFSYIQEILLGHISGKLFYLTVSLPFFFVVLSALVNYLQIELPILQPLSLIIFIGLVLFASIVEFFLGLMIVLLGFWFEGSDGLEHFKWIFVTLFSGWLIPIEMMPTWLREITVALPFKYMYAVPIETLLYQRTFTDSDLLQITFFITFLFVISYWVWQRAKLQYTSAGG